MATLGGSHFTQALRQTLRIVKVWLLPLLTEEQQSR